MANSLTLPDDIQKMLAVQATAESSREPASTSDVISTRGKRFRIGDTQLPDELLVVVAGVAFESSWFDRAYDPNNTTPPACFALSLSENDLSHHEDSPVPQHEGSCTDCEHNQWGTGVNGKGKACKNSRRLVLLAYGDDQDQDENLTTTAPAMLKVPPTSIKHWSSYSKAITGRYKRPTSSVVTRVSFNPDVDYPQLQFELDKLLDSTDEIRSAANRVDECQQMALKPYNVSEFEPLEKAQSKTKRKSKMN
tara:strand:+ start:1469 stop:2221 length:753 start_codon:yes stop_codon:yes gene_type:complete